MAAILQTADIFEKANFVILINILPKFDPVSNWNMVSIGLDDVMVAGTSLRCHEPANKLLLGLGA